MIGPWAGHGEMLTENGVFTMDYLHFKMPEERLHLGVHFTFLNFYSDFQISSQIHESLTPNCGVLMIKFTHESDEFVLEIWVENERLLILRCSWSSAADQKSSLCLTNKHSWVTPLDISVEYQQQHCHLWLQLKRTGPFRENAVTKF